MKNQWNPKVIGLPHKINREEYKFNLELAAQLLYAYFCQFQEVKPKSSQFPSVELNKNLTLGTSVLERTGSDD